MDARSRWLASGILAFRLPSGFIVSGVWPSLTDLARRGLLPFDLRRAVLEAAGKQLDNLTQEDVSNNLEQRQRIAAGFIRGLLDDESETFQWDRIQLTFEELVDGSIDGDDLDALDTFVVIALRGDPAGAALTVNAICERNLFGETIVPAEAGDQIEDLATFRDDRRGGAADPGRADVEHAAERPARDRKSGPRVSARRRAEPKTPT